MLLELPLIELDFGEEVAPPPPLLSLQIVDLSAYARLVEGPLDAHRLAPTYTTAVQLSEALIHAVLDTAGTGVEVLLSNSWGKDSTSMVGLYVSVLLERKLSGRSVPRTLVVTADTGSEFLDMIQRTEEENAFLTKWAAANDLPIECHVVRPKPKDTLLANMIGCGRPLPKYSNSTTAGAAQWCVDRLKVGPIEQSIALAKSSGARLLHFLGVRSDESSTRASSIAEHCNGLPFGLSRVSMKRRRQGETVALEDYQRIGVQPIVHWDHEALTQFLRLTMAPWNVFSYESLKEIYRRAGSAEDANGAGECRITLTKDGGVSNACSDLSGARMGCLLCLRSQNKSLQNYAAKDKRYRWVHAAHRFMYLGIRLHQLRMQDIRAHGWDNLTLFPKTYSMEWRYRLLMLVFRAEQESGFTLITPGEEQAIAEWWQRSGVFTIKPADAREDVRRWIKTGQFSMWWKAAAANYENLSVSLSEGLPGGVYAHAMFKDTFVEELAIPNVMALAGRGNGFYPQMKAYLFRDLSERGGWLTMLSDTPSDMARRLNTDALNGFSGFALELIGTRDLTAWENQLLRGRMIFYRHAKGELEQRIQDRTGTVDWEPGRSYEDQVARDLNDILLANLNLFGPYDEHALADHWSEGHFIATLGGKITLEQLARAMRVVGEAVVLSDSLSEIHEQKRRLILRDHREILGRLGSDKKEAGDAAARAIVKGLIKEGWRVEDTIPDYLSYVDLMRQLDQFIREGWMNTELANRLAYIMRTDIYDASYAEELMGGVTRVLFPPKTKTQVTS